MESLGENVSQKATADMCIEADKEGVNVNDKEESIKVNIAPRSPTNLTRNDGEQDEAQIREKIQNGSSLNEGKSKNEETETRSDDESKSFQTKSMEEKEKSTMRNSSQILHFKGKLVILGDIAVGKTAIVTRCESNRFTREQKTTIGVAFTQKTIQTEECVCRFDIWDSAGEERFRSINSLYYHGAGAGIVVFDVSKKASFESAVNYWIPHLRDHGVEGIIITLVANKCDLLDSREVSQEEAVQAAERENVNYFETSAKNGKGVLQVFHFIASQVPRAVAEQKDDAGFRITQVSNARQDSLLHGGTIRLGRSTKAHEKRCC